MSVKPRHLSLLYVLIPVLAVLTTWATGLGKPGTAPIFGVFGNGFPLPWKIVEIIPTCNGCPLPTSYNWTFFILDAAFYAAIGYGIVFPYARLASKQEDRVETQASKPVMRLL